MRSKRRWIVLTFVIIGLVAGLFAVFRWQTQRVAASSKWDTEPVQRGNLQIKADANGVLRANQSAELRWRSLGRVSEVQVQVGEQVTPGQKLADLDPSSLPAPMILARADLLTAEKALQDLQNGQVQQAQARQAVEDARQALEDAQHPESKQAEAKQALADAEKALETAERNLSILTKPATQAAIDQAYANMVLAKNVVNRTQSDVNRVENKLNAPQRTYQFWESRHLYKQMLNQLELKLANDKKRYEHEVAQYDRLKEPPDPNDVMAAQAAVAKARAELDSAQRGWDRVKDGTSEADLSVLQAKLADAERAWGRVKNGTPEEDLQAAEARVTAAQAALSQASLTAPFKGTITRVDAQPGDQVAVGTPALRLDDLSHLLLDVPVSEIDLVGIRAGQPVTVIFDFGTPKQYQGKVVEIPRVGDISQGLATFNVVVELVNPDAYVRPGMTAEVQIVTAELQDVLIIPGKAIRMFDGQKVVYILEGATPVPHPVTLGATSGDYSAVLESDLRAGDRVVLNPPAQ